MADYSASGVWARGGCISDLSVLNISEELIADFAAWVLRYDALLDDAPFDYAGFSQAGRELAVRLKRELPSVSISYYDEAKNNDRPEGTPAIWDDIN